MSDVDLCCITKLITKKKARGVSCRPKCVRMTVYRLICVVLGHTAVWTTVLNAAAAAAKSPGSPVAPGPGKIDLKGRASTACTVCCCDVH